MASLPSPVSWIAAIFVVTAKRLTIPKTLLSTTALAKTALLVFVKTRPVLIFPRGWPQKCLAMSVDDISMEENVMKRIWKNSEVKWVSARCTRNALYAVKCLKWKEKRNTFAFKPNVRTVVKWKNNEPHRLSNQKNFVYLAEIGD